MSIFARANFDLGANGANVTVASEPDADSIGGTAPTFSNAWSKTGSQSMLTATGAFSIVRQNVSKASGDCYWHSYIKRVSDYSNNVIIAVINDVAGDAVAQLFWKDTGELIIGDGASGGVNQTSAIKVLAGGTVRLEWHADRAAGTQTLDIFTGANIDGETPDETISGTCTGGDGTISWISTGMAGPQPGAQFAYDDLAVADEPIGVPLAYVGLVCAEPTLRTVGDGVIRRILRNQKYAVANIDDDSPAPSGFDAFVISESSVGDTAGSTYDGVAVPCVVLDVDSWVHMRLIGSGYDNCGSSDSFALVAHEITVGLPSSCVVREGSAGQYAAFESLPAPGAAVFAKSGADATYVTGFTVEKDAALMDASNSPAPARRVALSFIDSWMDVLTADGETILIRAVAWAMNSLTVNQPIVPDSFVGSSLGSHWTAELGMPATTLTVTGGECRIRAPMGQTYEAPTTTVSADTSFGMTQALSGDFDIAVQAPALDLYNVGDCGFGLAFFGSDRANDHVVIHQAYHSYVTTGQSAAKMERSVLSRSGGVMTSHLAVMQASDVLYDFVRVARAADSWTVYGSTDGVGWKTLATFTASIPVVNVKIFGTCFGPKLGQTLRVSEVYDVAVLGTDLRAPAGTLSGATTWTTDFASMPAWLNDDSIKGSAATVGGGELVLHKSANQYASAFVSHAEWLTDVDVTFRFYLSAADAAAASNQFAVFGIGGSYQCDQYSLQHGYLIETDADNLVAQTLRVHDGRNLVARTQVLNNKYDFRNVGSAPGINESGQPAGWALDSWCWVRLQRIGDRVRWRGWADGSLEPGEWFYDAHDEGYEGPGRVWIAWGMNSGGGASNFKIADLTITGVSVGEPAPAQAITGVTPVTRWRADSLAELADTATVQAWPGIGKQEMWLAPKNFSYLAQYRASAINSLPAVYFDGVTDKNLNAPIKLEFDRTETPLAETTLVSVVQFVDATGTQVFMDGYGGRNSAYIKTGNYASYAGTSENVSTTAADTNPHVITATFPLDRSQAQVYLDGALIATGAVGTDVMENLALGAEGGGANPADIMIAEAMVFDHALDANERGKVHSYVQNRYAIAVSDYQPPLTFTVWNGSAEVAVTSVTVWNGSAEVAASIESVK